jgi:hypothetical protein
LTSRTTARAAHRPVARRVAVSHVFDNGGAYQPTENGLHLAGTEIVATTFSRMQLQPGVSYHFGPAFIQGATLTVAYHSWQVAFQIVHE